MELADYQQAIQNFEEVSLVLVWCLVLYIRGSVAVFWPPISPSHIPLVFVILCKLPPLTTSCKALCRHLPNQSFFPCHAFRHFLFLCTSAFPNLALLYNLYTLTCHEWNLINFVTPPQALIKANINKKKLRESKAAKRLFIRVNKMLNRMQPLLETLGKEKAQRQKIVEAGEAKDQDKWVPVLLIRIYMPTVCIGSQGDMYCIV